MDKILIAGGTGFVGKALIKHLLTCGYDIHVLTRSKEKSNKEEESGSEVNGGSKTKDSSKTSKFQYFNWDIENGYIEDGAFEGVSTIINLTGANIGEKRWTTKRKTQIIQSRVASIELLFQYVQRFGENSNQQVKTFISSSAVGYYGAVTSDKIFTEEDASGNDFLASVCIAWENAALKFKELDVNTIILRKGVVIGESGGMYQKLAPLAKLGINVALGSGKQYLPWVDIRDLVNLYSFILDNKSDLSGVFNVVSSEHLTMNQFSDKLLLSFGKKSFLPNAPSFLIKLLFGEMSVMLLEGSRVSNQKLLTKGFIFDY